MPFVHGRIFRAALVEASQIKILNPHHVQDGRVVIRHVHTILHSVQTQFIRAADDPATPHTAVGQQGGRGIDDEPAFESPDGMVVTFIALCNKDWLDEPRKRVIRCRSAVTHTQIAGQCDDH